MQNEPETFEQWAIIELFGYQKIAGCVREAPFGSGDLFRVDVPASGDHPAFTQLYGTKSVYRMTFVTEEIARAAVASLRVEPVQPYKLLQPALWDQQAGYRDNADEYQREDDDVF